VNRDVRWQSIHRTYLQAAYELGELRDRNGVPPEEILELLDLGEKAGDEVLEFLVDAGMIVWPAKGKLMLTELGLRKAEELERGPQRPAIGSAQERHVPYLCHPRRLRPSAGHLRAAQAGEGSVTSEE
jgi:hypothetical protein